MSTPIKLSALTTTVIPVRQNGHAVIRNGSIYNPSNAVAFLQLFDAKYAHHVTLGTTVPKLAIAVPTVAAIPLPLEDVYFKDGIMAAFTTTAGGSSAPSTAGEVNLVID